MLLIIKIYLLSVLFWFLLIEITGLLFKKRFIRNTDIIKRLQNDNTPRNTHLETTLLYLRVSFIPVLRIQVFLIKMIMTFFPGLLIEEILEERKRNETI
jgi:hypothetical protein